MFTFATLILLSCSTSVGENGSIDKSGIINFVEQDTIRPKNVGQAARLVNVNFDDAPLYQWIEYVGPVHLNIDVHAFKFYNLDGSHPSIRYYKKFGGLDTITSYGKFDIRLGLGTSNLWLNHKGEQAWFCFINAEKNQEISYRGKLFKEVTSINNVKYEGWEAPFSVVVSPQVYLHFERTSNNRYNVLVMDEMKEGKLVKYVNKTDREIELGVISYFDWRDGKIYLPGGSFLEPDN